MSFFIIIAVVAKCVQHAERQLLQTYSVSQMYGFPDKASKLEYTNNIFLIFVKHCKNSCSVEFPKNAGQPQYRTNDISSVSSPECNVSTSCLAGSQVDKAEPRRKILAPSYI